MKKTGKYLFVPLLVLMALAAPAQTNNKTKAQLEKERNKNLARIKESNKILEQTRNEKKATMSELNTLKKQIGDRENLIYTLTDEVTFLEADIKETNGIIESIENDLDNLKEEYSSLIVAAYRYSKGYNQLLYILSADNFNQFIVRVRYFREYSKLRNRQLAKIEKVKKALEREKERLQNKIDEKNGLLTDKVTETNSLNRVKSQKDKMIQELSQKEKQLKKDISDHQKANEKLEKQIKDKIRLEIEKAREKERIAAANKSGSSSSINKTTKTTTTTTPSLTPEARSLSGSFEANRGKLPWPVQHGSVSHHFGKQAHPVLKGVYVDNLGVDIITLSSEQVRTVFKGKVISVSEVPGMNQVVMIQHGEYFTVYAKLKKVYVTPGQDVVGKQIIGEVYTNHDNVSEVQFHVWKNDVRLDPELWIIRK